MIGLWQVYHLFRRSQCRYMKHKTLISLNNCSELFSFVANFSIVISNMRKKVESQSRVRLQPHGQQPTRLLCPWDSPGKNTGVGCHFLLQSLIFEVLSFEFYVKFKYPSLKNNVFLFHVKMTTIVMRPEIVKRMVYQIR